MTTTVWTTIALHTVGTVLIKSVGPIALGGRELPPKMTSVVARLAPSRLAALVGVATFGGIDETAAGLLAAAVALLARLPMIVVVLVAAAVTAGLRLL